jgi:hypothetical protein
MGRVGLHRLTEHWFSTSSTVNLCLWQAGTGTLQKRLGYNDPSSVTPVANCQQLR